MKKNINIQRWEVSKAIKSYYMVYAMKTIVDRALPDVRDGFKPVHRRILFKMNQMGLNYKKERAKCVTIVGEVLNIHGHGDASVYDALAKLTEQQDGQTCPYIDGEGAFGKQYLADSPSASRYTFARLNQFSDELFENINKGVVKIIGEDKEHSQPLVLPTTYPNILIKQTEGIAVGMSCYFPSFNLSEVCNGTIAYIENPEVDLSLHIKAPDFSTGGHLVYDENEMRKIIAEGKGKLVIKSKYRHIKERNCIEVYEIPHNTTANAIIKKITDMIKFKTLSEVTDVRDSTGYNKITKKEELKITIDIKKNTDVEKLMAKLYKTTTLQRAFTANMNCLVNYKPMNLGIKDILKYWLEFRRECIINGIKFDVDKMENELHFLKGLEKVLIDIDKAIDIIRKSDEKEIIKNLCEYFQIDEIQAEDIANMKLRYINKEYILNKIKVIEELEKNINKLKRKMDSENAIDKDIAKQLKEISEKYGVPRKTEILYNVEEVVVTEEVENYNVMYFYTKEGYLKKIPLTSLRSSGEHKLKENDEIKRTIQGQNIDDILVFTESGNIHRIKASKLEDKKASDYGVFLPSVLGITDKIVDIVITSYEATEDVLIMYSNGYVARVDINAYKSNYTVLKGNIKSKAIAVEKLTGDINIMPITSEGKGVIFYTNGINRISSRTAKGVKGISVGEGCEVIGMLVNPLNKQEVTLVTSKKGDMVLSLKDVSYYAGSRGNVGVFLYNCRQNKDCVNTLK